MAASQLTDAPSVMDHPAAMSPADTAAHAANSYVRPAPVDSDPNAEEVLRRVRGEQAPLSSIKRREVRTTMARVRGW